MKDKDITSINVDDYIREVIRKGINYVRWGKNGAEHFKNFAKAVLEFEGYKLPKSFFSGFYFMGVKHYRLSKGRDEKRVAKLLK